MPGAVGQVHLERRATRRPGSRPSPTRPAPRRSAARPGSSRRPRTARGPRPTIDAPPSACSSRTVMAFFGGVRSPEVRSSPARICSVRSGSTATHQALGVRSRTSWSASMPDSSTTRWISGSRSVRRTVSSTMPCDEALRVGEVGHDVVETARVGRELADELGLLLRVLLVLEDLRDAQDPGQGLLARRARAPS